ncbi:glycerol-3-phosphate dehydrogenase/oxidase [Roseateles amylovorans]|uniref:Glycerol-3-phosphate dehydrogenase/oxidase n=1 Tax=Roseateles amylovorans TaxID=2978473 RepID=A0ABY6B3Q2_9BURK|nr:glycerol-3-phosphate dehydrogenase/oxidase [Roseateles amylovorans]UXH80011.1 glycerol-3-phosphate dehydrogenase/oxidase [Roseateles amylovorans]
MNAPQLPRVRPADIAGRHFSTVIIGAGINGVGVFRDLALQGVDCLIIDKADFAAGASSAPSRMIHGGLRYLEHGDFALVAESTRERNRLLRNAPHLVRPLETVVPLSNHFGGLLSSALRFVGIERAPGSRGLLVVALGLRLYDLLGRRQRQMPNHRIERLAPGDVQLFRPGVRWCATYFDAWISHPEWLVLELLGDALREQPGSAAINHCRLLGSEGHQLRLRDELSGEEVCVSADCVVNATGAWLDRSAQQLGGADSRVMGTKGSHLVLEHAALRQQLGGRMAYFEAADGRVCIVYPFLDRVLVGSTDIPVDDPDQVRTEPAEVDYLLAVLREVFPRLSFGREQVLYTYVGVRPLARARADQPGQISREHAVVVEAPHARRAMPLVGLVGGKWTTFRALAEQACDAVLQQLGRQRRASTCELPIGGGAIAAEPLQAALLAAGLDAARAHQLQARYGSAALPLARRFLAEDGDLALAAVPGYSAAELRYLCRETGVQHLADLLLRRTLLAIRGLVDDALLAELAGVAAEALGWDIARREAELHACAAILRDQHGAHLGPRPASAGAASGASAWPLEPISSPIPT